MSSIFDKQVSIQYGWYADKNYVVLQKSSIPWLAKHYRRVRRQKMKQDLRRTVLELL